MRATARKVTSAFLARRRCRPSIRDRVDGLGIYLFDNLIAEWRGRDIFITDAGWPTRTTRDRLNGLLEAVGDERRIHSKGGRFFLGDLEMPRHEWFLIKRPT